MSSALPCATRSSESMSRISRTRSRNASACAMAPPSAPPPMIATKDIDVILVAMSGIPQTLDLTGKVALVTGGSRGIGLAIADALLEASASVVITARTESHLKTALDQLSRGEPSRRDRTHSIAADIKDANAARDAVDGAVRRFGGLDVLVNNAGVGIFRTVADMDLSSWHDVIGTNLSGVFYCCHAAIPHMQSRGG